MTDDTKKTLTAVGVGVGATSIIATAMYFLGGREAPKLPSFGELTGAAKREIGFGALSFVPVEDLPSVIRKEYGGAHLECKAHRDSDSGDIIVSCKNANGTAWKDYWIRERDYHGSWTYTLGAPYGE